MNRNQKYGGLDWFRIISAILVITIHTSPLLSFAELPDFILTRIIARVAVPFFLMVSGFFLLPDLRWDESVQARLKKQLGKLGILYLVSACLYVPFMIYNDYFGKSFSVLAFLKDVFINGTFYHLWYLPAAILGLALTGWLLRHFDSRFVLILSAVLYGIGLFGDSYYGMAEQIPWLRATYAVLFRFTDYTRNGLFYVPIFLMLGYGLGKAAGQGKSLSRKQAVLGLIISGAAMIAEGLYLHKWRLQRHDSMYATLPLVMVFLFACMMKWNCKGGKQLNRMAMLVYIIHPAMIVVVRLAGKLTGSTAYVTDQSLIHFMLVAILSFAAAWGMLILQGKIKEAKRAQKRKQNVRERAWTEISIDNLYHNIHEIQEILPERTQIMAVVKTDGYGNGGLRIAGHLNKMGINAFAVTTMEEGVLLRRNGIEGLILIMGRTEPEKIRELERFHLTQTIDDPEYAEALNDKKCNIRVHVRFDVEESRSRKDGPSRIEKLYRFRYLQVDGIYTNLTAADSTEPEQVELTQNQIQYYYDVIDYLKSRGIQPGKMHIQNSYGILNYPELDCDYARIGTAMYGILSRQADVKLAVDLRPVITVKAKVAAMKLVKAGETIGYGRGYVAKEDQRIAIVTIGYGEEVPGVSEEAGLVLVHGGEAKIVGKICMDQMMVDVTGIENVKVGDVVTMLGDEMDEKVLNKIF